MVCNETTNDGFILLSKQGRTQLMYSTKLTTEHVFENFGGNYPVAFPLIAGSASKTCQHHLVRNKSCKRLGSRPKRSINLAKQTGKLSRPVC